MLTPFTLVILLITCSISSSGMKFIRKKRPPSQRDIDHTWNHIKRHSNKFIRPNFYGPPTRIYAEITVFKFGKINDRDMTFKMDISLSQSWHDPRLKHNLTEAFIPHLGLGSPADIIWIPDSVIINAIQSKIHSETVNNYKLLIYPNGTVYLNTRASVTSMCEMNFKYYPLDVQFCHVGLESYAYPADHLLYFWNYKNGEPNTIKNDEMAKFTVEIVGSYNTFIHYSLGNFSLVQVEYKFTRRLSVSIIQIFFPTISIVCVSWTSFFIHKNCVSSRVNFGVTTLLTLSYIWGSVNVGLPKVDYIKAIDIYFLVSFTFILFSLVEYTLVMNTDFRRRKDKKSDNDRKISVTSRRVLNPSLNALLIERRISRPLESRSQFVPALDQHSAVTKRKFSNVHMANIEERHTELDNRGRVIEYIYSTEDRLKSQKVIEPYKRRLDTNAHKAFSLLDRTSRFLFPAMFLTFNLVFWVYYSTDNTRTKGHLMESILDIH